MYVSARSSSGPRISSASSFVLAPCVWILMKRHSGRPSTWMSARIQASMPDLGHTVAAQRGDKSADFVLGYRLYVVEVGRAVARHAFVDRQDDFRGDVTDRRRHRGDRHLTERVEDGVTSENDDRPPLVGCGEPVPADLASPHGSTQVCSRSQASNSPRPTGLRAYPSRCFCSRLRTRTRLNASRSASRAKADRLVPSLRTTRSTAVTSSSSSVI